MPDTERCNWDTHIAEIVGRMVTSKWAMSSVKQSVLSTTILQEYVVPPDKDKVKVKHNDMGEQTFNLLTLRIPMIKANQETQTAIVMLSKTMLESCYKANNQQL